MPERLDSARWRRAARRTARTGGRRLQTFLGGPQRSFVIVVLACVLALSSADAATVGAAAIQLRKALHVGNTDIGLLVAVSSLVAAGASVPFGVLADRFRRTWILGAAVTTWGLAMLWSATATSFGRLLLARIFLGMVTASAGPVVASLVGDYFGAAERGRIYSYILTGELAGAGLGFAVTGDIAALSWRAALVILAIPAFVLARYVFKLKEPVRGGRNPLPYVGDRREEPAPTGVAAARADAPAAEGPTDAQKLAEQRGIEPDWEKVLGPEARSMNIFAATRAVLRIRTNVILIVASACGYFYLSGVETFGSEYVTQQYHVAQALANLLLLLVGVGAVVGVFVAGGLSDRLLHRGFLNARIVVPGTAAVLASVLFIPAIFTRSAFTAVPYLTAAALMLAAQNPPIDAGRLDIVPPFLWGRAEGIRTTLRTVAQSGAPAVFGFISEHLLGGGRGGLQLAFTTMLVALVASGVILLRATRTYPRDVATAAAGASSKAAGPGWPAPPPPPPAPASVPTPPLPGSMPPASGGVA